MDIATTLTGAAGADVGAALSTEDAFQRFYDNGGLQDAPKQDDAQSAAQLDDAQRASQDQDQQDQQAHQDDQAQQDDTPAYASLEDLLKAHKIDPESVKSLHVTTTIDGKTEQVPLEKVLKSYQLEGHVNNKSIELSNQRNAFEQERTAVRTMFQQQLQQNQALGNLAQQMLTHEFQQVDWNGLRANNPAEFAALSMQYQNRQGAIQQYMQHVQQQTQQAEQAQQQAMQQSLADENTKLMEMRQEWRNPETFSKDRQQMTQYARSLGFKDAELGQIFDHRYMLILHDAARYQALQAATPQALKQVRQAPPQAAPGSRTDVNPREAQRKNVVERFNRNPRDQDAQAAAFEFFANQ